MATTPVEVRLRKLEEEMKVLQRQVNEMERSGKTRPEFLDRVLGMYANEPEALSVLEAIEQERANERANIANDPQGSSG